MFRKASKFWEQYSNDNNKVPISVKTEEIKIEIDEDGDVTFDEYLELEIKDETDVEETAEILMKTGM